MADQCALDKSGNLKEAEDIEFFFSESEKNPLPSSAALSQCNPGNTGTSNVPLYPLYYYYDVSGLRRGERKRNIEKMHTSIAAEQCSEYGAMIKKHHPHQQGQRSSRLTKKPKVDVIGVDHESDPNDGDFASDGSSMESSEVGDTEIDEARPSNAEVCFAK
jgi:hypothetical protein